MAKTFRCSIVTPVAAVLDDEVTYATFPAHDGQMGMLPGRSPLLTRLGVGALRLDFAEGGSRWFLIDSGFAQVRDGNLTLLTESAAPAETLSAQQAEKDLAAANARVTRSGQDQEKVQHDQRLAMARKALVEQLKQRGGAI